MKKYLSILLVVLVLILTLALYSCGGHKHTIVVDEAVDPTCISTGLTEGKHCSDCGEIIVSQQEVPMVAHIYDDDYDKKCNVCDFERIVACGHDDPTKIEIIPAVPATCQKTGLSEGIKCTRCATMVVPQVVVQTIDCIAGDWIVDKEATTDEEGLKHTECTMCGKKMSEENISRTGSEGLEFTLNDDCVSYTLTSIGSCTDTEIIIPKYYNGYPVTRIGHSAFLYNASIISVVIPNGVISIDDYAFVACTLLKNIEIPNSVKNIGEGAFGYCSSLTSVEIPNSVKNIGYGTFVYCSSLTSVEIPDSVTNIGGFAFGYCSSLTSVEIPSSVRSISPDSFAGCTLLTSIVVGTNNQHYQSIDGNLYTKDGKTLVQYAIGKEASSFEIPDFVTNIADYAFAECKSLTSIGIPNSVTSIGWSSFYNCTSLTSIEIPDSVTSIGGSAFDGCTSIMYSEYDNAYYLGNNDNPYIILLSVKNTNINNCEVHYGAKFINSRAFVNCNSLTNVTIPNSVTSIGSDAFWGCDSLTSIKIPDSVISIGAWAFAACTSLSRIYIPDSVTSIGYAAFAFCESLTIYCEAESQPSEWDSEWNTMDLDNDKLHVIWGYKGE